MAVLSFSVTDSAPGTVHSAPIGYLVPQPAIPATNVAWKNLTGIDATVYITGGTISAIKIGTQATGLTAGGFRVPSGQSITMTYTVVPTSWKVFLD